MKKLLAAGILVAMALLGAPVAGADTLNCQVQGVLVIVAIESPVTVCSIDTNAPNTTNIDPSLQLNPHLFGK